MKIDNVIALVTGGASGLGAACAKMLAVAGGRVVICDIDAAAGAGLAAELGRCCRFVRTDVTSANDVAAAIQTAREDLGGLHVAINCAGLASAARVIGKQGAADLETFSRIVRVNLVGTFNVVRLAAEAMAQNDPDGDGERGVIVNTASVAAYDGQIGQTAYAASKGGIAAMTLPLARDLASNAIRVVAIAPGVFDTPMLAGMSTEVRAALEQSVPFPRRLGRPGEFALLARQIIENPMLNGEVIRLDGALRMAPR